MAPQTLAGRRIVLVMGGFAPGGTERQVVMLGRFLKERYDCDVQIWAFDSPDGQATQWCDAAGLTWRLAPHPWRAPAVLKAWTLMRFRRALAEHRPDAVLAFTTFPNVACALSWRAAGARAFIWNQRDAGLGRMRSWLERRAIARTPQFIANAQHAGRFLTETYGLDSSRVAIIPNGIELTPARLSREAWREQLAVGATDFVATMLANLRSEKDHATLLRAWRIVADAMNGDGGRAGAGTGSAERNAHGRRAILVFAGAAGDAAPHLRALARSLDLEAALRMIGCVDDIAGLLQASDLGVLSTHGEGLPNAVLECMAARLAVVGTDVPGVREALGSGEEVNTCLAQPTDHQALARRILAMAEDDRRRSQIGQRNEHRIASVFSPERMGRQTAELIARQLASEQVASRHAASSEVQSHV